MGTKEFNTFFEELQRRSEMFEIPVTNRWFPLNQYEPKTGRIDYTSTIGTRKEEKSITYPMAIKRVIFNDPATIVMWEDGTKTVVKVHEGDVYDPEKGLAMAISKKALGNKGNYYETFKRWMKKCQ